MRKKSILVRPDQVGYTKAIDIVFEALNMREQDQSLLFDYLVNEVPMEELIEHYQLTEEEIKTKVAYLIEQMKNNPELLQIRNHSNLKGKRK